MPHDLKDTRLLQTSPLYRIYSEQETEVWDTPPGCVSDYQSCPELITV